MYNIKKNKTMEHLTLETFKEKIMNFDTNKDWKFEGELPAILKFSASWCGPCKALIPTLEKLAIEYSDKINIYEIDVDEETELSTMFNIRSVPSMLFIPMNGEPQMSSGVLPITKIKETIENVLMN